MLVFTLDLVLLFSNVTFASGLRSRLL